MLRKALERETVNHRKLKTKKGKQSFFRLSMIKSITVEDILIEKRRGLYVMYFETVSF